VSTPRIREAGDSALLVEFDPLIDERTNARAIALATQLRREVVAGVRDVVPTYRSVGVYFDPLVVDAGTVRAVVERSLKEPPTLVEGHAIEVPTVYGGEAGPDLAEVASHAGLTPAAVVACHASVRYRVFMVGFLPGFPYMGTVDERIAMMRRATPRLRVPAGSVGIAGRQTGIYPVESPGGWQIIGRSSLRVFDPGRVPAALFQPGDTVRFVPVQPSGEEPADGAAIGASRRATPAWSGRSPRLVTVLRPGLFTTVQDEGRWGHQASGVPVGGALDVRSHKLANIAVGNERECATLEVTIMGPELRFDADAQIAIVGADLQASVDGRRVHPGTPTQCPPGSVLRFGERRAGARAYVAFDGGITVAPVLGSRATHAAAAMGGVEGRALVAGDRLPLGVSGRREVARNVEVPAVTAGGGARLRVLVGPQDESFPSSALELLFGTRFTVTPQSDRMGYRLSGARLPRLEGTEMISDVTFTGAIQVPSSGEPILLMSDRQTTGGYPQIATVITADLPVAGQLAPGDWVEYEPCTLAEALSALGTQEATLRVHR